MQLPAFNKARVTVVGDAMLDRYWTGQTARISPEAPVPVVHVQDHYDRPGGAANVAINLGNLGVQVTLLAMTGKDPEADCLETLLRQAGVKVCFQRFDVVKTITKLRVLSQNQQLLRVDVEEGFHQLPCASLIEAYKACLQETDVVILSDYGKGTLQCSQALIQAARMLSVPVIVDPKGTDFGLYQEAMMITPNRKEFEAVVGVCETDEILVERGNALMKQHGLDALLVTRGQAGMTLFAGDVVYHLPAHATEVYDVTGAGDTVIAVLGAALAAGEVLPAAALLSNTAAGVVVRKLGAATVSVSELRRELQHHQSSGFGVVSEAALQVAVEDARAYNERVVMTNGCFDLLHAGHVAYLEEARALGDRLIVAVNDDDSVRRLKGRERPVNTLAQRMSVLAGLRSVDWVVSFSEDTPERLIAEMLPDVLAKGGDYRVEEIAGHKQVLASGGEVRIIDFVDGRSTSGVIERIRALAVESPVTT